MPYNLRIRGNASEDRLERLIEERLKPEANKKEIDQRIWNLFGEEWAVMFTDLSGFSRKVAEFGIIHFLQIIYESERLLIPIIDNYDGILLKIEGDSFLIIFRKAEQALKCAIDMNKTLYKYNLNKNEEEKVLLCLGIGFGKLLKIGDYDVYGSEVNAASKLGEDTAKAYEILITENVKNVITQSNLLTNNDIKKIDEIPPGSNGAYKVLYNYE